MKKLIFSLCFLLICGNAFAAISFDSYSEGEDTASYTNTFAHTVAVQDDRILIVSTAGTFNTAVTGVTYNGDSLIQIESALTVSNLEVSAWYMLAPDTGTHNVVVTMASFPNSASTATSYYGVKQQAPEATSNATGTGTALSDAVTTITSNAWVVDSAFNASGTLAVGAGQTERGSGRYQSVSTEPKVSAGSVTMSWTVSESSAWGTILSSWEEASSSPTGRTRRTMVIQ